MNRVPGHVIQRTDEIYDWQHSNSVLNNRVAVIVEGRDSYWTPLVIKQVMHTLGTGWNLHVFGTHQSYTGQQNALAAHNFTHTLLPVDNLTVPQYSKLLTSKKFWEGIREEHILIFHIDSLMLRSVPDELFMFDYIGAPCGDLKNDPVMNGGTSLRRRSAMIRACELIQPTEEPEDVVFCRVMRQNKGFMLPSLDVASAYFCESHVSPNCVGAHGTNKGYLSSEQWTTLLMKYRY